MRTRQPNKIKAVRTLLALAAAAALGPMAVTPANAATCTWNSTNGNWNELSKWLACVTGNGNPTGVPGSIDTANIGATGVVNVDTAQSILNLNNAGIVNITATSLTLLNGSTNNTGGSINVSNGAVLNQSGSAITGGTINTTGTGVLRVNNSGSNFLNNVALNGVIDMSTVVNARQRIAGGMVLNGSIDIANGGILSLDSSSVANQTLSGTGTINLNDATARLAVEGNGMTTLGANIVVRGQGNIGTPVIAGGNNTLVNNGRISADVAGSSLNMANPAGGGSVVNNGTLDARNGGQLVISTNVNNTGGQIAALNGSNVLQSGIAIAGGTINTAGTGVLRVNSSGNTLSNVTLNGVLDMSTVANARQRVTGGMVLNGSIGIANGGILSLDSNSVANQTLSGTGTINLNDAAARLAVESSGVTTLGANIVVRGQGNIGQPAFIGGNNTLVNNGRISADVAGGSLNMVNPAGAGNVVNNGKMDARNGGQLVISTNVNNTGGQLAALNGSNVLQSGSTITGGTIDTTGTGVLRVNNSGSNFLSNVTLNGVLDISTVANARQRVTGGMVLNGSIDIANGGILSLDSTSFANQTLGGTGTINLNDAAARLAVEGNGMTTLGANIVVRGQGNIGQPVIAGGNNTLVNNGRISADVAGGSLNMVNPAGGGSFINNGTLDARNGGTLLLSTAINNTAGQITAQPGSIVRQNGAAISGGVLNSVGTGAIQVTFNGSNLLRDVTLSSGSVLDMTSVANSRNRLIDSATIAGAINIGNGGILSLDASTSTGNSVVVNGSGVINLNDAGARLAIEGTGTTTLGAALTVRGQGNIGQPAIVGGNNVLSNDGRILADGGTLTITAPAAAGRLQGSGTLEANGGTLNVSTGSGSTQGRLVIGATGSLGLGTQNLTLNNDYTNVQAGSGNGFNRRAGVIGSGLILAGGNAAQLISGTGVTGGSTTNATLTLGNMRVGANTYNVNIGNSGSTGPTLRGAIQTSVNGGNITDARLGGSGVAAGNYNAGGPGGAVSAQVITFTAASAGALTALSGQAINLRSNFGNIDDQRLNIVLAGGAAAYNAAVGSTVTPVQVANQRVGGSNSATLAISNTAAAGSFSEDLNASIGSFSGQASAIGSVNGRLAGTNNTGTGVITVGVNTAAAGARTGGVTLNYQTAGAVGGVSNGLGTAAAGSQVVTVNGNVFQVAQASPGSLPAVINLGNFRAGAGAQTQTLIITNTSAGAPVGFQEGLAAAIVGTTGAATGIGFSNATTGNSGALVVGLSGIAAGINTGSAQVQLRSNGITTTGSNGLGDLDLGSAQTVTVNGTGWRLAQANAIAPVNFGNVLAGSTQERFLTISNTALGDGFSEALNAAFGANGGANPGRFSTSGSINGLLAGAPADSTSMRVTLNTSSTGAVSANVQILLNSNGTAVNNGLGLTSLPTQTSNLDGLITGVVGNLASAGMSPTSVNFGKFREGAASQTQQLTITNLSAGPGEGLNASFGTATGVTNNGASIASLAPTLSNTAMSVTLGGLATAGAKSGTQVVNFASDGTFNNGTTTALPSQTVTLNAEVYRVAQGSVTPTVNLAARRVGDAGSTGTITIANSAVNDGFSERLAGTLSAAPSGFVVAGPAATGLISAGSNTTRGVTLNTTTAGSFSGNVNVALVSNGAGTSGFGDLALPGQSTAVTGNVYTAAIGQTPTTALNFGIVRVGDTVSAQNIVINNNAAVTALNDTLSAGVTGVAGPFSSSGVSGVVAGGSGTVGVALNTTSAGVFTQTALVAFTSQNADMTDISAGADANVTITAQVNNLANAVFRLAGGVGSLSQTGTTFYLDYGNLAIGDTLGTTMALANDIAGPADDLRGSFDTIGAGAFSLAGWGPFSGLMAGNSIGNLGLNYLASSLGAFTQSIFFNGFSVNASDTTGISQNIQLVLRGNVLGSGGGGTVPEPGSLSLVLLAVAAAGWSVRRRSAARAGAVQ